MLEINLTKNTNDAIQGTLGKYYGRVEYKGTLGVKDLAKIMKKHTTAFSLGEITGMLLDLASLIKEYALMGYVVKIDDLGLFKASIDANGLTLEQGSRVSAGRGAQKTDEQLAANPSAMQFAVGAVKMIMQATGETTIASMNGEAQLQFTSKTKALIKQLTGNAPTDDDSGEGGNGGGSDNNGGGSSAGSETAEGGNSGGSSTGSETAGHALTITKNGSGTAVVSSGGQHTHQISGTEGRYDNALVIIFTLTYSLIQVKGKLVVSVHALLLLLSKFYRACLRQHVYHDVALITLTTAA